MKRMFSVGALLACSVAATAMAAPRMAVPQGTQQTGTTLTGTVSHKDGKFYVKDQSTQSVVEVRGSGLEKWVGKHVRVAGLVTLGTVARPEILVISEITKAAGMAVAGGAATAAGVKAGLSTAAVVGVGAGATAATVGTLVATDVIGGNDAPASNQ
ncbi:MAG TPA: hypothetical protein VEQ63_00040 [Bryobacteraceae bacterium]|nr:hypothetical protein [Bryobacteraceae bacterium]